MLGSPFCEKLQWGWTWGQVDRYLGLVAVLANLGVVSYFVFQRLVDGDVLVFSLTWNVVSWVGTVLYAETRNVRREFDGGFRAKYLRADSVGIVFVTWATSFASVSLVSPPVLAASIALHVVLPMFAFLYFLDMLSE